MTVADIGAGYGYFSIPSATIVGEKGRVYAVEPDPDRAKKITQTVLEDGIKNIVVVVSAAEQMSAIPSHEVDFAMAMSSVHHFTDLGEALAEVKRIVRPGGTFYVRDLKAGRIIKHGSNSKKLRATLSSFFPGISFREESRHIIAIAVIPAESSPPS